MECYTQTKYTSVPPKHHPCRESCCNNTDNDNDNNNDGYQENTQRYQKCTTATEPLNVESHNNNGSSIPIGMLLKSLVFAEITFKWPDIIRYSFFATGALIALLYFFPQSIVLVLLFLVFIVLFVLYFSIIKSNKVDEIANKPVDAQKVKRWREQIQQKKASAVEQRLPPPPPPPPQLTSHS